MISFDVYDTLVTRKVAEPKGIFYLMAQAMCAQKRFDILPDWFIRDFVCIRMNAEKQARNKYGREIRIEEIYECISENYGIPLAICDSLVEMEKDCEITNTVIIQENIERVKGFIEAGEKVILISDMYLGKEYLKKLFDRICPILNTLPIYVSCDTQVTKSSGSMYKYVQKKENCSIDKWFHIGDNIVSDVSIPELLGIKTELYEKKGMIEDEIRIKKVLGSTNSLLAQCLIGMQKCPKYVNSRMGYRIGFSFVGVILYAYVDWIINQAEIRAIKHLYFVARDGYVLKQIADILIKNRALNLETHYLYGSRKAWRVEKREDRSLLKEYLNQELPSDDSRFALVDTQGTGKSIEYLSQILGKEITIFYYVLLENKGEKTINPIVYSTYAGNDMIEIFCRAPHGSTIRYEKKGDKVQPILSEISSDVLVSCEMDSFINGVVDFSIDFSKQCEWIGSNISLMTLAEKMMHYCVEYPDVELANFIGQIPHDIENLNENRVYAPLLSKAEIKQIEYDRTTEPINRIYTGVDLNYSYFRLDESDRKIVQDCRKKYYKRDFEKKQDALHVVIYGYGKYGQELLHRLYGAINIVVDFVVDANYIKYKNSTVPVMPLRKLIASEYDFVVISLYDQRITLDITQTLLMAGIPESKILTREVFLKKYLGED